MFRLRRACAVAAAALALGCTPDAERAERARLAAEAALAHGDLRAAREAVEDLRRVGVDSPEALVGLTSLMSRVGEAPRAIWLLEEGLARFPDADALRVELGRIALIVANPVLALSAVEPVDPGPHHHLPALLIRAGAELELGRVEEALSVLEHAEELYPDSPGAGRARIAALVREGRFGEAAEAIEGAKARRVDRGDEPGARSLELLAARIEAVRGDPEAAIERLRVLHGTAPSDASVLQVLANLLVAEGRADEARAAAQTAVEAEPEGAHLWAVLAQTELQRGDFAAAESAIQSAVDRTESPTAYILLADFRRQRGDPEGAADAYVEGAERFPDAPILRMHRAEALIDLGRLAEARTELSRFETERPDDPHVDYLRARIELAEGNPSAAATRLRGTVAELDRAYTQFWLGRALEATGDVTGAERRYGLALVRGGANPAPAVALLSLSARRGDWSAVARRAVQLIRRSPGLADGYETAVTAYVRTGALDDAEPLARRYLAAFPSAEASALLALTLRAGGRLDEAEAVLEEAEAQFGPHAVLLGERGMLLGARGRFREGIALARLAIEKEPGAAEHRAALAGLLFGAGDTEGGSRAVDRALELDPDDPDPLKLRARYLASRGRLERAQRDVQRYLWMRPRDASVQYMHGVLLAELGHSDAAIAAYRRAISLDEGGFEARNNLALILADQDDLEAGLAVAQKAYALAETNPHVIDTLGWLYLQKGLTDRSVALLERAHALAPELAAPQLHLALAYREAGRMDEARRLLADLVRREEAGSPIAAQANDVLRSLGG